MATALITGASSGLGKELARLFAADRHDVVLVARRRPQLEALSSQLVQQHGITARVIACDLSSREGVDELLRQLEGVEIDFLVNNAGFGSAGLFSESDAEREARMTELNVTAVVRLTRALLPAMLARRRGRILNVGSTAGFQPGAYMTTYYATKAFVNHFSQALSVELRGTGVTVTLSCPGPTNTEFVEVAGTGGSRLFHLVVASAAQVAREQYGAMQRGRVMIVHGLFNRFLIQIQRISPRAWVRRVVAVLNRPRAEPRSSA
ncbi:MAG TPA: SDR family oxidoreductase [Polyangiaceae bacterium]